jgi:sarcosine oxidase
MRARTAVVGRGLIGSAAARHLARAGEEVVLVGPGEPVNRATHDGVFASHYDEGRITRVLDASRVWATLALRSLDRYREIERASGIDFYTPCGFLSLSDPDLPYAEHVARVGASLGVQAKRLDAPAVRERFPFLHPGAAVGLWQAERAGHISPRRLVAAQVAAARKAGANVLGAQVLGIELVGRRVRLRTRDGDVEVERALVACGAFTDRSLTLGRAVPLDVHGRTVVLARVEEPTARALSRMPSLIGVGQNERLGDWYALPPIRYPDGARYVKIGTGRFDHPLPDLAAKQAWFRGPPAAPDVEALTDVLFDLVPVLAGSPIETDNCAYTCTPTGKPFIDWLEPGRVAVAVGGNGKAAKSSDEIGRLAAGLLTESPAFEDYPDGCLALPALPA